MFDELCDGNKSIAVIGLGYVGLPLAIEFAKHFNVVGFDVDKSKIDLYKKGIDVTCEVGDNSIKNSNILFTSDEKFLKDCSFFIVAVPTPINNDKNPDFKYIISASEVVARNMSFNSIVVFESTVYPGVTEEICLPILESISGMKCPVDFKIGYSPERISPGDKKHTLRNITKIVSGIDDETLEIISLVYGEIIDAGIYKAESIKIAEAAKVVENTQRDINIAFINEISMVFNKMGIDTHSVLKAANTKWNFLNFSPGLVGGHCISVDPYYFIYKANHLGYDSPLISISRRINDDMGNFVGENVVKKLIDNDILVKNSNVLILGFTFKENCVDVRNTKVIDIYNYLKDFNINVDIFDPIADKNLVFKEYGVRLLDSSSDKKYDAVIVSVAHDFFKEQSLDYFINLCSDNAIIFDIKSILDRNMLISNNLGYWSL